MLTATYVREVRLSKPGIGRRGYNEDDVDQFLSQVVARLELRGELSAADVREVTFRKPPWGKRGYDQDEVDEFLDRIAATLDALAR